MVRLSIGIAALLLTVVSGGFLVTRYFTETQAPTIQATAGADPESTPNRVDVDVLQTNIADSINTMNAQLRVLPQGDIRDADVLAEASAMNIRLSVSGTAGDVVIEEGQPIRDINTTLQLIGHDSSYPFDHHTTRLTVSARQLNASGGDAGAVPVRLVFAAATQDYGVDAESLDLASGRTGVEIDISRSPVTIAWAIVMMVIYWSIALLIVLVMGLVLIERLSFRFDYVLVTVTTVFAFVAFRTTAPGNPPLGSLLDYLAFFWAELLVASSAIGLLLYHVFTGSKRKNATDPADDASVLTRGRSRAGG